MTDSLPEVKGCPFCGEKPELSYYAGSKMVIRCRFDKCHITPEIWGSRKRTMIERWNKRAEATCAK